MESQGVNFPHGPPAIRGGAQACLFGGFGDGLSRVRLRLCGGSHSIWKREAYRETRWPLCSLRAGPDHGAFGRVAVNFQRIGQVAFFGAPGVGYTQPPSDKRAGDDS